MLLRVHASAGTGPGSDVLAVCCQWITPTVQLQEAQAVLAVGSQPASSCCWALGHLCAASLHLHGEWVWDLVWDAGVRRAPNPSGQPWVQVGAGRGTVGSPGAVGVGSIDD